MYPIPLLTDPIKKLVKKDLLAIELPGFPLSKEKPGLVSIDCMCTKFSNAELNEFFKYLSEALNSGSLLLSPEEMDFFNLDGSTIELDETRRVLFEHLRIVEGTFEKEDGKYAVPFQRLEEMNFSFNTLEANGLTLLIESITTLLKQKCDEKS